MVYSNIQLATQVQQFISEAFKRPEIRRLTTTFQSTMPRLKVKFDGEKVQVQVHD